MSKVRLTYSRCADGVRILTAVLGLAPTLSPAAGSPSFPPRIKSVHELIVEGERPEISACLYAAQLSMSNNPEFERIHWGERVSDQSVVVEYRLAGDWVRVTKFEATALPQGTSLFSRRRWVDVWVECQQVNEKAPIVTLRLKLEKAAE